MINLLGGHGQSKRCEHLVLKHLKAVDFRLDFFTVWPGVLFFKLSQHSSHGTVKVFLEPSIVSPIVPADRLYDICHLGDFVDPLSSVKRALWEDSRTALSLDQGKLQSEVLEHDS